MGRFSVAALLLCGACGPQPGPAPEAAAALEALAQVCREVGGTPRAQDALRDADLDGDGRDEQVLFSGWITCENAPSIYGDREKGVAVFTAQGVAFEESVFDVTIERSAARAELWLTLPGPGCGYAPAPTFAEERFCQRAVVFDSAANRFARAPLETIRAIE
jgi:hypothetical protein